MPMTPALNSLIDQVRAAHADGAPLELRGGGTKAFYGEPPRGRVLDTRRHAGILNYQPTELVVTAACGTPLAQLEAELAAKGQALAFEPPHFGPGATVGGMVAAGLSGPSRASAGAVRDHLLGAALIDARGELMQFGGEVMKNVAGYDVSRVLAGSLGTLGLIAAVSLKVLPVAPATATVRFRLGEAAALDRLNAWGGQPLPLDASAWWDGTLLVRLRGADAAVHAALARMASAGGEPVDATQATPFWTGLREQTDEFFAKAAAAAGHGAPLWRLSVPQTAPPLGLSGEQLIEWHGAQRWWCTAAPAAAVRRAAASVGGHATLFRTQDKSPGAFTPLDAPVAAIHHALKHSFDPDGLFCPGRLYPGL